MEEKQNSFEQFIKEKKIIISIGVLILLILIPLGFFFLKTTEKKSQKEEIQIKVEKPTEQKISIPCPSIQSFCQNYKTISKRRTFVIGGILSKNAPVYAPFDGSTISRSIELGENGLTEKFQKITLTSKDGNFLAEYYFKNLKVKNSSVKKGDLLFTITSEEPISYYGNYNLVFEILDRKNPGIEIVFN